MIQRDLSGVEASFDGSEIRDIQIEFESGLRAAFRWMVRRKFSLLANNRCLLCADCVEKLLLG
jgi:hypothetical protein